MTFIRRVTLLSAGYVGNRISAAFLTVAGGGIASLLTGTEALSHPASIAAIVITAYAVISATGSAGVTARSYARTEARISRDDFLDPNYAAAVFRVANMSHLPESMARFRDSATFISAGQSKRALQAVGNYCLIQGMFLAAKRHHQLAVFKEMRERYSRNIIPNF